MGHNFSAGPFNPNLSSRLFLFYSSTNLPSPPDVALLHSVRFFAFASDVITSQNIKTNQQNPTNSSASPSTTALFPLSTLDPRPNIPHFVVFVVVGRIDHFHVVFCEPFCDVIRLADCCRGNRANAECNTQLKELPMSDVISAISLQSCFSLPPATNCFLSLSLARHLAGTIIKYFLLY